MKIVIFAISFFWVSSCFSQIKAITESGEEVILYDNNTWSYVDKELLKETEILLNPEDFKKEEKSSFLVKSKVLDIGVYINPKTWSFKKAIDNEDAEFEFENKEKDLYGILINEKLEIPLKTLKSIVVENARDIAPDIHIVKEEYRMVNGEKILALELAGTTQGIEFVYLGYFYSYSGGTSQLILYTAQSLLEEYRPSAEQLLNGFVKLE